MRGRGGVEPLCDVYGPVHGPAIERRLLRGELEAIGFHPDVKVGTLPLDRVRAFGDPDVLFFNVNRPEDLARAEELWRRRGRSRTSPSRTLARRRWSGRSLRTWR